jgi:hypothetical protein
VCRRVCQQRSGLGQAAPMVRRRCHMVPALRRSTRSSAHLHGASDQRHHRVAGGLYEQHALDCEMLARAFDDARPIGAITRAVRVLAAPLPTNRQTLYRARNRGHLPCCPAQTRRDRFYGNWWGPSAFAAMHIATGIGDRWTTAHTRRGPWSGKSQRPSVWPFSHRPAGRCGVSSETWVLSTPVTNSLSKRFSPGPADQRAGHCGVYMRIDPNLRRADLPSARQLPE